MIDARYAATLRECDVMSRLTVALSLAGTEEVRTAILEMATRAAWR